jgi:hypothetical protein
VTKILADFDNDSGVLWDLFIAKANCNRAFILCGRNAMFHGVKLKILRLSNVLSQFAGKGSYDCIDVILLKFVVQENNNKNICMAYSLGTQKTDILKGVSFWVIGVKYQVLF